MAKKKKNIYLYKELLNYNSFKPLMKMFTIIVSAISISTIIIFIFGGGTSPLNYFLQKMIYPSTIISKIDNKNLKEEDIINRKFVELENKLILNEKKLLHDLKLDLEKKIENINFSFAPKSYLNNNPIIDNVTAIYEDSENLDKIYLKNNHNKFNHKHFIPPTSYFTGVLINEVSINTLFNKHHRQPPIIIKITEYGNIPEEIALQLENCKILCTGRGDILTGRAYLEANLLTCKVNNKSMVFQIEGVVNEEKTDGIKGELVEGDTKYFNQIKVSLYNLINIYNFHKTNYINSFNNISLDEKKLSLSRLIESQQQITDYYLQIVQLMAPTIYIPSGKIVNIVITRELYLENES